MFSLRAIRLVFDDFILNDNARVRNFCAQRYQDNIDQELIKS